MSRDSATRASSSAGFPSSSALLNTTVCATGKCCQRRWQLRRVEAALDVSEALGALERQVAPPLGLRPQRFQERQRLAVKLARHVPLRERARDWVAQHEDQFHRRVVARHPLGRRGPVHVRRRDFAEKPLRRVRIEVRVIRPVIDRLDREIGVGVEEVQFLPPQQAQLGGLAQIRVERRRAAFLRAGDDEAYAVEDAVST